MALKGSYVRSLILDLAILGGGTFKRWSLKESDWSLWQLISEKTKIVLTGQWLFSHVALRVRLAPR